MKILKIAFKNINSLKGEHLIDFEQGPLSEASLFAITGPTGSGKSTILDVICLALYSEIPRIGKTSKNTVETQGFVLTRNTKEANASVTYKCKAGIFTSEWRIKVNRNGNLNDYEMAIFDENGVSLGFKRGEVPANNAALIGLEYNQFIRSILLAQGAFAEFLKANEKERTEILEKITDGFIYRELGIMAFRKARDFEAKTDDIRKLIADYGQRLIEDDAFIELQNEQTFLKERIEENRAAQQGLNKVKELKEELVLLDARKTNVEELFNKAKEQLAIFEGNEGQRLLKHQKLAAFKEQLTNWEAFTKRKTEIAQHLASKEKVIEALDSDKNRLIADAKELVGESLSEESFKTQLQSFGANYAKLKSERENVETEFEALEKSLAAFDLAQILDFKKVESYEIALNEIQKKKQGFEDRAVAIDADLKESALFGLTESTKIRDYERAIDRLSQLEKNIAQYLKSLEKQQLEQVSTKKALSVLPDQMQALVTKCNDFANLIEITNKERELKALRAKLSDHRSTLKVGEPCPLCGSLEHPWSENAPNMSIDEAKIKELERNLKQANEEKLQLSIKQERLTTTLENIGESLAHLEAKHKEEVSEEQVIRATFPDKIQAKKADDLAKIVKEYDDLINQKTSLAHLLQSVEKAVPVLQEIVMLGAKVDAKRAELAVFYNGHEPLQSLIEKQLSEWQNLESELKLAAFEKEQANEQLGTTTQQVEILEALLTPEIVVKFGYEQLQNALPDLLNHAQENSLRTQLEEIKNEITRLGQSLESALQQLEEKKQKDVPENMDQVLRKIAVKGEEIDELEGNYQKVSSDITQQMNLKQDIENKQKELEHMLEGGYKWLLLKKHIGDSTGNTFSNYAQQLTLEYLVGLANNRLASISKRYLLKAPDRSAVQSKDDLLIIDLEMGNEERSVKTLSGGETFIISLALSLGLSDLAAKNIQIESLFIDEGFGTLDPESLDQVLDVLENLQANDAKTIGIISHVDALKERITTQIKLTPVGQGFSDLSVV